MAQHILPTPVSVTEHPATSFELTSDSHVIVEERAAAVGYHLAALLRPATGFDIPVRTGVSGVGPAIHLRVGGPAELGTEGYELTVRHDAVLLRARTDAGLFHAVQTLRQLLPAAIESPVTHQQIHWIVPGIDVLDYPRFPVRAALLDVSRHFLSVEEVKRYIDDLVPYKFNTFVLHLTDDQGWRLFIDSWPRLATYGGSTEVGGKAGGYYSRREYAEIVSYAQERFMTLVPEVDAPGHTNAALASYPELNRDAIAPPLYTDVAVGFSSLWVGAPITYRFLDDVVREIAELTPGEFISIGGDEAQSTSEADYRSFMTEAQKILHRYGKSLWGWHQIAAAAPPPGSVAVYWGTAGSAVDIALAQRVAATRGRLVLAPADHAYLDIKYDVDTQLGLEWVSPVSVTAAYDWDPDTLIPGVGSPAVLGVLAALWTETINNIDEAEFMAFPRAAGIAEIGWSPPASHDYDAYRIRLAAQGLRWTLGGVSYYPAPDVPWERFRPD